MSRAGTHHKTLSSHQMSWMQWVETYHHGLSSQNTSFRNTCATHHQAHESCTTQDWAQGTIGKIGKEGTALDHILDTADITAPAIMTSTEATPDHSTRTDTAAIEVAQDNLTPHTGDIAADPAMTHYTSHTTHISHSDYHSRDCSRTHCSSSGYCSWDHSRSSSWPSYHSSKYRSHQKGLWQLSIIFQPWKLQVSSKKEHEGPNRRTSIRLLTVQIIIPLTQEKNWSL